MTKPFLERGKILLIYTIEMEIKLFGADSVFGRYFMERGRIERMLLFTRKYDSKKSRNRLKCPF